MGLADDFFQFGFGIAAAEGEGAGEMLPILQRQSVKFAGDEDFQCGALLLDTWDSQVSKTTLDNRISIRRGLSLAWL